MIDFESRVTLPSYVLLRNLDGESVLLNLNTERYFGLDTTGTRMLQLATTLPSVNDAYQKLLEEFEVEPQLLRENLQDLLHRLNENGLVSLLPADVGSAPAL